MASFFPLAKQTIYSIVQHKRKCMLEKNGVDIVLKVCCLIRSPIDSIIYRSIRDVKKKGFF